MYRVLLADDEQIERMALARRLMRRFGDILQLHCLFSVGSFSDL